MKVLFVVNMEDFGFEEPLGVLYLSAACKKHNHRVYAVENILAKIEDKIRVVKPDLIAVSALTPSFPYLFQTIRQLKAKYNVPVVFGGPHPTFFKEIVKHKEIDYIFMGEGEEAFAEFLNLLEEGKSVDDVRNLVFVKGSGSVLRQNPLRPLINNLDRLPFPDRELFAEYKQFYKADVRSVMASRGCPYMCSYCYNNQYQKMYSGLGDKLRVRSVDNLVEECFQLKNVYRARMIHFFDDIFPFQNDWIEDFADKYKKRVNLPFFTNTSFNVCSEHYIRNLSRAGCKTLLIGVETGNESLRERVLLRKMSNKIIIEKARLIHSYGIKIYTQNLIGIPYGSLADDIETLKLNILLHADFVGAYFCQPYPNTVIEKMAKDAGLLEKDFILSRSFYYSSPLKLKDKKSIERLRVVFPLVVNSPFLFKFIYIILKMPPFPLKIISNLLHGYKIRTVVLRYNMSFYTFIENVKMFFIRRINCVFHPEITVK